MHYLLDTHVFIWWIISDRRLSAKAQSLIRSRRNAIFWSVAGSWEISIKYALGKLTFDKPPEVLLPSELDRNQIELLPIMNEHAFIAGQLPAHHKDPFDRIIIWQAIQRKLTLVSKDRDFKAYRKLGLKTFW